MCSRKILVPIKTLQHRLQKNRSYNTNKELMENDSKGKLLEKRGGGGTKEINELVPFGKQVDVSLGGASAG